MPPLDGIVLTNLLHFLPDQAAFLRQLHPYLQPEGRVLVVEYEQEQPLPWIPFPLPFAALTRRAATAGFATPRHIGTRHSPSSGRVLYAAVMQLAAKRPRPAHAPREGV